MEEQHKTNLLKMADYIETIPQELFDMGGWREDGDKYSHECKSIGCVLGHCTILDTDPLPKHFDDSIDFRKWSEEFTGINSEYGSEEWKYLFDADWDSIDNTPTGAAKRIRYFVENGLPTNWDDQLYYGDELSYK